MDLVQSRKSIANTFENQFDKVSFTKFVSNLLNSANFSNTSLEHGNQITEQYKDHIKSNYKTN